MATAPRTPALTPLALRIKRSEKKQQFAEGLRAGALSPLQAGISGTARNPIQTAVSPFEVISKLLQAGIARKVGGDAEKEYDAIASEMAAQRSTALGGLGGDAAKQQDALDAGVDPSVLKSIADAKKLDARDTGGAIELTDQSGATIRSLPKSVTPDAQLSSSTAIRGQDLGSQTTRRGQDIGATTAEANRRTTERGQDISAQTSTQNAKISATNTGARNVASLRKEFRSLPTVKAYESVLPIVTSVAKAPDTPAGDLQVVYSVGQLLDPGSVVKEGELKLTQDAPPFLQRLVGKVRAEVQNKGRLTPQTRKDFVDMLQNRVSAYRDAYTRDYDTYAEYANGVGAEPDQIVGTRPETAFDERPPQLEQQPDFSKFSDDEIRRQLKLPPR